MTPIKDYALIGNCETAALINPQGGIDWLCLPAFDSPSLFARLLDEEKGGDFAIRPVGKYEVARSYFEESAILQTRFKTPNGVVRLTDFFVLARQAKARFYDFTSLHPTRRLVRLAELEEGKGVAMEVSLCARPDYARARPKWKISDGSYALEEATFFSNAALAEQGDDLLGTFELRAGSPLFVVADYNDERVRPELSDIYRWLKITQAYWREWNLFNYYRGPHLGLVRRSAVTLKLLTYAGTGAFVAAPTTSLPERIGGDANWDYRYTWVRDTALFIQTLFGLGYSGEAKAFLEFWCRKWNEKVEKASPDPDLPTVEVLYPVCEQPLPPETALDHLAGYADSRPVRIGNRAAEQLQLDNYGHILQSFLYFRHSGGEIDRTKRKILERLTEEVKRFWRRPDNGIWEEPEQQDFTYGKVMCWVALERARALLGDEDGEIAAVCAAIEQEVMTRGLTSVSERKILSAKLDQPALDASSLLAFTTGFLSEHVASPTRVTIEEELGGGPFLYRNPTQREKEGAFLLCSFWRINHLVREGKLQRAEELLQELIAHVSPLGLLAEEIDPATGAFLGNFPQAFSHLGLIQTILNLENAKKKPGFHALSDHEKFKQTVGATIGAKSVVIGFFRVPRALKLLVSRESKWREK